VLEIGSSGAMMPKWRIITVARKITGSQSSANRKAAPSIAKHPPT
jgi:hypothetical protein